MTATAKPPVSGADTATPVPPVDQAPLRRAEGVELLGDIHGCGYRDGACLARRADGQMLQLGPMMYALLDSIDGQRATPALANAVSARLGRRIGPEHVVRLAEKLARQGLLKGTEHRAPPRRNPLLALRWKVLVTNPQSTRRLTAPFTVLLRPWLMWPFLACFGVVFWFVLIHKGVASATSEAFRRPGLLLLVFALAVVSAGFHELGHAAAARYAGATPGGMGMGLYLVWPAFYTDVTDAYRLPKRDRLRIDLAGLYFNTVVAVVTMAVWLAVRSDALLLLVALQVLQMVKQLSPVIRADGYHILSDATGVPDLYAHLLPTMRGLLPGKDREPSPLSPRARLLVTAWVLIVVPVMLALMLGAVLLLPRLATTAWGSGRHIVDALPHQVGDGQVLQVLASLLSILALMLPVLGSALVGQKIVRTLAGRARSWSRGRPARQALTAITATAALAGIAWAWWPAGQYQPIRPTQNGTLQGLVRLVSAPAAAARPSAAPAPVGLAPGTHLAIAMIPVGGATRQHPAVFIVRSKGHKPVAVLTWGPPRGSRPTGPAPTTTTTPAPAGGSTSAAPSTSSSTTPAQTASAFPFTLPAKPGPGGTQAVAVGTQNGGVTYNVAYALLTVKNDAPVTNTNSAFALASCNACTTVAVSFQVVLIVGQAKDIAPINAAGALNYNCPACSTTAIAEQLVITLKSQPPALLLARLEAELRQLNALPLLGAGGTPAAVSAEVSGVEQEVEATLAGSGLLANPPASTTTSSSGSPPASSTPAGTTTSGAASTASSPTQAGSPQQTTTSTTTSATSPTVAPPASTTSTPTQPTTTTTTTTIAPAASSTTSGP